MPDAPDTNRPAAPDELPPTEGPAVRLHHDGPLAEGVTVRLAESTAHHALRVLRLRNGEAVELFNGDGRRYRGALRLEPSDRRATVAIATAADGGTESRLDIRLAQALPGGDKMDWVLEKATELGATVVQPLQAHRCVVRLDAARAARRIEHWRRIVIASCMQCGRDRLPSIEPVRSYEDWIRTTDAEPATLRLVLAPRAGIGLHEFGQPDRPVWLLVGPEGGLTEKEVERACLHGWQPLRLGPRVLRTETAGLAAIAALQARFGDF